MHIFYGQSSKTWVWIHTHTHNLATFSTASREALFLPLEKNSFLAFAHGIRSTAVRAARCSSPSTGSDSSSRIRCNILQNHHHFYSSLCRHIIKLCLIPKTQEIKRTLFNWTKQGKMCKFSRKSSFSSYIQHKNRRKKKKIMVQYFTSVSLMPFSFC